MTYAPRVDLRGRRGFGLRPLDGGCEVLFQQLLDLRQVRATVEPRDHALLDHEDERGDLVDGEFRQELRMLVGVHAPHAEPVAFLPGDVREEALHAARRA